MMPLRSQTSAVVDKKTRNVMVAGLSAFWIPQAFACGFGLGSLLKLGQRAVLDAELDLVGVALQLRGVHRVGPCRQGAELARNLGAHLVADRVLAASEMADE